VPFTRQWAAKKSDRVGKNSRQAGVFIPDLPHPSRGAAIALGVTDQEEA
jgi:hypothetical protein